MPIIGDNYIKNVHILYRGEICWNEENFRFICFCFAVVAAVAAAAVAAAAAAAAS